MVLTAPPVAPNRGEAPPSMLYKVWIPELPDTNSPSILT